MYDLLIRNAQIVDGTGGPAFAGDVALAGERIAAVGAHLEDEASAVLEAGGLVVAPGFIDAHTHDDLEVTRRGVVQAKVQQGITTLVLGNCGFGIAPMVPHLAEECWRSLGHDGLVATLPWPATEPELLVDGTIVLPIQINGKRRGELTIGADASEAEVEKAALALEPVQRALEGRTPRKVIVVPKRIVNVVV